MLAAFRQGNFRLLIGAYFRQTSFLSVAVKTSLVIISSLKRPVVVVSLKLNCQRCISEVPQYKNIK